MAKIAVATLGCKVNHYESAGVIEELARRGHEMVPFASKADLYIVNTCTVTAKTDYQSRQLVRRANRRNPDAPIVVTGCYAQTAPHALSALPGVKLVAGTEAKERIPDLIENLSHQENNIRVGDIRVKYSFSGLPVTKFQGQTRAYLKIQDGCNAFCSYCIIPYARGPSRSLPPDRVIDAVSTLRNEGYREIVLTGIHLGLYGLDLPASPDLAGLLRRIEDETSLERLRISSIEPMEISESLIETLSSSSAICRHLHIPLQSGSNRILFGMKRSYTAEDFRRRIEGIADRIPDIAIGVDVMTGFPGEGEDEFDATRSLLESLPLAYLHVFPYSKRPGTEAADFAGQVAETDKKERAAILRNLGAEKKRAFFTRYIGETLSVLVEAKPEGAKGRLKGFSGNYIPTAIIEGTASLINSIVDVKTVYIEGNALVGRIA